MSAVRSDGKSVGVVELEDDLAGDDGAAHGLELGHLVGEDAKARVEGLEEALLLVEDDLLDEGHPVDDLGVGVLHDVHNRGDDFIEEGLVEAQELSVPAGAAQDAPEHVAAALVGGQDAVADQEEDGAGVVGDDPHGDVVVGVVAVLLAGELGDGVDDRGEEVRVVVALLALDDGRQALEAHARVDVGLGKGREAAVEVAVELREDVVPDLQVPVAGALDVAAGLPAAHLGALVVEDLGAGAAGARLAHHPEVAVHAHADDAVGGHALLLVPDLEGLVVVLVDRDVHLLFRKAHDVDQEVPAPGDGLLLEVIAEGEVAEHLEEGVVARRVAHVFQVVVLAARAHALLGACGPVVAAILQAQEAVLELHHSRVGEEKRRVILGDERRARDDGVAPLLEVLEKFRPDLTRCHVRFPPRIFPGNRE